MSMARLRPRITPARPGDCDALARILARWVRETPWMPNVNRPHEDRLYLYYLIDKAQVFVLRDWRGAMGFVIREGDMVHALYLAPRARGRGHGKRLLEAAKRDAGALVLWAYQANGRARAFYQREGFAEVEFTDGAGNDENLPDVRLEWKRCVA